MEYILLESLAHRLHLISIPWQQLQPKIKVGNWAKHNWSPLDTFNHFRAKTHSSDVQTLSLSPLSLCLSPQALQTM